MQRYTAYVVVCSVHPLLGLQVLEVVDAVKVSYLSCHTHCIQWYGNVIAVKDDCEKTL